MRRRVAVLGTLGTVLTAVAAAFVLAPDTLLAVGAIEAAVRAVSTTNPTVAMLAATLVVVAYLAVVARTPALEGPGPESDAERRFERAVANPPEAVTADRRQLTAAALEAELTSGIEAGGEGFATVRATLIRTATHAYAGYERTDVETARAAIAAGTWTDDRTAAAFLADEEGPTPAASARIRLWLAPERERGRRVDRTVAAIRDLGADRR